MNRKSKTTEYPLAEALLDEEDKDTMRIAKDHAKVMIDVHAEIDKLHKWIDTEFEFGSYIDPRYAYHIAKDYRKLIKRSYETVRFNVRTNSVNELQNKPVMVHLETDWGPYNWSGDYIAFFKRELDPY